MNNLENHLLNEINRTENELNIHIPSFNKKLQLQSNGKSFSIYEFQFYGVGFDKFPNEIISTTKSLHRNSGIEDFAAIGEDGSGGYFLIKRDKSNKIYFWDGLEIFIYAEDSEKFFEGFKFLEEWTNAYTDNKRKEDPNYDEFEDPSFGLALDEKYNDIMKYINNQSQTLEVNLEKDQ